MPDWSLVSRPHVLSAIQECDRVGSTDFLSRYRFGRARASTMWHSSEEYDPLAILGFAHLEATGHAPTSADMGDAEAADVLTGLGFDVVVDEDALAQIKTKPRRTPGSPPPPRPPRPPRRRRLPGRARRHLPPRDARPRSRWRRTSARPATWRSRPRVCATTATEPIGGLGYVAGVSPPSSLRETEARQRADLIDVTRYDVSLDFTGLLEGAELRTTSRITFTATPGSETFVDCQAGVDAAVLNGSPLPCRCRRGRPDPAHRSDRAQRARRRLRPDRDGERAGGAQVRGSRRRRGLRLDHLRAGRGTARVRLLRPARPQGGLRDHGEAAPALDRHLQQR